MRWQLYEDVFDLTLFRQMVSLVYRLSAVEDKKVYMNNLMDDTLFWEEPEQEMEEAYGLRYPGEVLERLGEKREITIKELRSIGLALAETKQMQEDGMFIGNQLSGFWKRVQREEQDNDLYLMGIYYLYDDKRKKELFEKLINYDSCSIKELLYILYLLPDDDKCWEKFRPKLEYNLGTKRNLDVYENFEVYIWLFQRYQKKMKAYKKKDMPALKYLMKLPYSYAKEDSTCRNKLLEHGYSVQEIMFLSMMLLGEKKIYGKLKLDGLAAERMAVETCTLFLNGKEEYPDSVYRLCAWILNYYKNYKTKLNGESGIFESLRYILKIENVRSYQFLFQFKMKSPDEWFYIDLTDRTWDSLFEWMERAMFDQYVSLTLSNVTYTQNEILLFLKRYEEITGEPYELNFWKNESLALHEVFQKLFEIGVIKPPKLLEDYISAYESDPQTANTQWKYMSGYLIKYIVGMHKPDAYQMLKRLIDKFGIPNKNALFSTKELLFDSINIRNCYWNKYDNVDFIRPFLNVDDHRQLFLWAEQYIFKYDTESYVSFLTKVLLNNNNLLWFEKDDAREVFLQLQEFVDVRYKHELRNVYLSQYELEEFKEQSRIRKEQQEMMEKLKLSVEMKKDFTITVAKYKGTDKHFAGIRKTMGLHRFHKEMFFPIVSSYVCHFFDKTTNICICKEEIEELFLVIKDLFMENKMDLNELKKIINYVEIKEEKDIAA